MALINCPECGKQISDKAANCPNCGYPVIPMPPGSGSNQKPASAPQDTPLVRSSPVPSPQPQAVPKRKESVLGIIGLILSVFFCLPILAVIGFVLCIIAIFDKKHSSVCATIGIILCVFSIIIGVLAPQFQKNVDEANKENQMESSVTTTDTPLSQQEMSIIDSQENTEVSSSENVTREDFIASCEEIPYKTLARYPEDNAGKNIVLTVQITQILQGGWFDHTTYYRVYTDNDGYGLFLSDEYLMYDSRIDDDTKLLESDIIKVYGEFIGTESITRALTGTAEDIPAFKAYYVDILDEDFTEDTGEYATIDKFNQIENGMTYDKVVEIMGTEGEAISSMELMGIDTAIYQWSGKDGISNATVTFENSVVSGKIQLGLD